MEFYDIPEASSWADVQAIDKGYSSDRKYLVQTKSGGKLLLRISGKDSYEKKKKEYEIIKKYAVVGFPMSMPIAFGICGEEQNVYMVLSWVEGCDLEKMLPKLSQEEQYRLGRQAGSILKGIHGVHMEELNPLPKTEKKIKQLERYLNSSVRAANDESAVRYVRENFYKMETETFVYQHGDFHPGNLIYMPDGNIGVIDFNRWEAGDPYEEFLKLQSFGVEVSIPYCVGQIDEYFDDKVPMKFWETLAVYVAHTSLYSIAWAEKFGQADVDGMLRRWDKACHDYDDFRKVIPGWYEEYKRVP